MISLTEDNNSVRNSSSTTESKHENNKTSYNTSWIRLTEPKQWSRLLYPNPVCLLCTVAPRTTKTTTTIDANAKTTVATIVTQTKDKTTTIFPSSDHDSDNLLSMNQMSNVVDLVSNHDSNNDIHNDIVTTSCIKSCFDDDDDDDNNNATSGNDMDSVLQPNVMVLSWLTALNNKGYFIFSINRHRYTATSYFSPLINNNKESNHNPCDTSSIIQPFFVLSVPVAGMENMVRTIGMCSGRLNNKFSALIPPPAAATTTAATATKSYSQRTDLNNAPTMSKRQKKKHGYPNGIPDLKMCAVGNMISNRITSSSCCNSFTNNNSTCCSLFAIEGTVAHIVCKYVKVLDKDNNNGISNTTNTGTNECSNDEESLHENDHWIIMARVVDAYVLNTYWDNQKSIFRPQKQQQQQQQQQQHDDEKSTRTLSSYDASSSPPPFFTFFGSQEFGYIVS